MAQRKVGAQPRNEGGGKYGGVAVESPIRFPSRVNEAAQGINDIAKNIGGVATAARNTTQGANDTKTASLQLSEMAARLQAAVAKFTF